MRGYSTVSSVSKSRLSAKFLFRGMHYWDWNYIIYVYYTYGGIDRLLGEDELDECFEFYYHCCLKNRVFFGKKVKKPDENYQQRNKKYLVDSSDCCFRIDDSLFFEMYL